MRLLLVEDARLIREPLSRALELSGWEVETAADGEGALKRLSAAPVDAVVLDIMLPGNDGFSVLSELRARGDDTPVVLLTARDDVRDRVRGLDLVRMITLPSPFMWRSSLRGCVPFSGGVASPIHPRRSRRLACPMHPTREN